MVFENFFSLSHSEVGALYIRGGHSLNQYYVTVYGSIMMRFTPFFQKGSAFQMQYMIHIFIARWRYEFREMAVKNCENSKNWQKSLCAPLHIDS